MGSHWSPQDAQWVWETEGKVELAAICLASLNPCLGLGRSALCSQSLIVLVAPSQPFSSAYSIQDFQTDLEWQNPASSCMAMDGEGKYFRIYGLVLGQHSSMTG